MYILPLLLVIIQMSGATTDTTKRTYNVTTWSGAWEFTGYAVGPSSGRNYILMSSSGVNQCALIKEYTNGTVEWAKLYQNDQCSGLSIDSSETYVYYANNEAGGLGINQILCSSGESNAYYTNAAFNISGGINTFDAFNNPGYIMIGGNLQRESDDVQCGFIWEVSTLGMLRDCSGTYRLKGFYGIPGSFCYLTHKRNTNLIHISCHDITTKASSFFIEMDPSTAHAPDDVRVDVDSDNIYIGYDEDPLSGIYFAAFDLTNGSIYDAIRHRTSSESLTIGSVYSTGSSVCYVSSYTSSSAYAELIKFDFSNSDYTIYVQSDLNLRIQFINTNLNNCWYALEQTENIHLSQLSSMNDVDSLSATVLTNTGLSNITVTTTNTSVPISFSSNTSLTNDTNAASTFTLTTVVDVQTTNTTTNSTTNTTTTTTNNENNSDDTLSPVEVVLIVIGTLVGVLILLVVVASVILLINHCCKKLKSSRTDVMAQEPVNQEDESNALREENNA